jgi:hypothetical protein
MGHVKVSFGCLLVFKEAFEKVISRWVVFVKVQIIKSNLEYKGHEILHFHHFLIKQLFVHGRHCNLVLDGFVWVADERLQ